MITTSTDWDSAVLTDSTDAYPIVRLYYGDETNYVSISTKDVTFNGVDYRGLLKEVPVVT